MENPRIYADKSKKENFFKAIDFSLKVESESIRKNLQHFNRQRYKAVSAIEDYDDLKDRVRKIKEESVEQLPRLLEELEKQVLSRGGHFYLAPDAQSANEYIRDVCRQHNARLVVKAKSMTSEETKLNDVLEAVDIEVAETDLAEFILQVADEHPSHIVVPAIHRTQERIAQLFIEKLQPKEALENGEQLTMFARRRLREKFLKADAGITGANAIAADTGTILLVESEGNIRLTTTAPPVHIALAGVEKVIARRDDLFNFVELLAPSGTGQALTSYTHLIRPPLSVPVLDFKGQGRADKREFYLVLIDNGRMALRNDDVFKEALYCIRCSACLNVCPNFQNLGGHAFGGETYSGGIGAIWEAAVRELQNARFTELCTGCSRCINQCPARIDIPWLNENLRRRLAQKEPDGAGKLLAHFLPTAKEDAPAKIQKQILGNYAVFSRWMSAFPAVSNWFIKRKSARYLMEKIIGIDRRRPLAETPPKTLARQFNEILNEDKMANHTQKPLDGRRLLLFADVFVHYHYPGRGIAAARILKRLGAKLEISASIDDGRAALSHGMTSTAGKKAVKTAAYLLPFIEKGFEIIVIEPSVLAMFRRDYRHLLDSQADFEKLKAHSFGPIEYLHKIFAERAINPADYFKVNGIDELFYHPHCQQKTIGADKSTIDFLEKTGLNITLSDVECCGMAGSFGYKKDFYEVSKTVGSRLFEQIETAGKTHICASGISCTEQIQDGTKREVRHPIELLEKMLISNPKLKVDNRI